MIVIKMICIFYTGKYLTSHTLAKALIWGHKVLIFMSPVVLSIYPGPDDVIRPSNKMSLRPNNRNVS